MKKLSVEEKAARYDEAIKVANKYKDTHIMFPQIKDEIFPELKESEDERVRKDIKRAISVALDYSYFDIETANNCLAWLEKQGESDETKAKIFLINKGYPIDSNGKFPTYEEMYYIIKDGLEKQGKTIDTLTQQEAMDIAVAKCFDEQKPADKVEPKFKVGDWVVWDNKISCHIDNIYQGKESLMYTITDTNNMVRSYSVKGFDNNSHRWTIQYAKDGDVLAFSYASQNYILIYKRLYKKGLETKMSVFCFYCVGKDTYYDGTDSFHVMNHKEVITPATKEQCDLLFSKMKDAGYEWDAKNKELKKVAAPKFNVHDCIIKKHNSNINDFGSFVITDITGGKYWYNDRIICDISEQDEWELYEPVRQNPDEWSEEDEKIIKAIHNSVDVECLLKNELDYIVMVDWFKSLKDRVQPQQKEWSEEDERTYKSIIYSFTHNYPLTVQQQEFVKSLKDKVWPKQEWSDVDKDILFRIIDDLKFLRDDISKDTKYAVNIVDVEREINWLESIKYRYTWKPSDEQMNLLEELVEDNNQRSFYTVLRSLYEQLKKLREE